MPAPASEPLRSTRSRRARAPRAWPRARGAIPRPSWVGCTPITHRVLARSGFAARAADRRRDEPISTAFVESAVNAIVAKCLNKAQQMRWSRVSVRPFLDVRTAVLNDALEDAFRQRYPGFRPANDDQALPTAV